MSDVASPTFPRDASVGARMRPTASTRWTFPVRRALAIASSYFASASAKRPSVRTSHAVDESQAA